MSRKTRIEVTLTEALEWARDEAEAQADVVAPYDEKAYAAAIGRRLRDHLTDLRAAQRERGDEG